MNIARWQSGQPNSLLNVLSRPTGRRIAAWFVALRRTGLALLLAVLPGGVALAQGPLVNYQVVTGSAAGYNVPTIVGTFTETAGSTGTVCLAVNVTSAPTTQFVPRVEIYYGGNAYNGTQFDDTGAHYCFQNWSGSGTYSVGVYNVASSSVTGTFNLEFIQSGQAFNAGPLGGGKLTPGSVGSGSLDAFEYQLWTFPANAGDRVVVATSNITGETPSYVYLALQVYDSTGAAIETTYNDPAGVSFAATKTGYYSFVAYQYAYSTAHPVVNPMTYNVKVSGSTATDLQFIPITPCRVVDTRNPKGPFGNPELVGGTAREFDIPLGSCSIPSTAVAYSLNATVVPDQQLGYLTMWPSGLVQPTVSTLNSDGRVKANAAITPAGVNGGVSVYVTDPTQFILDIDGYFVPSGTASALAFYPVTPCRVVDTRNSAGPFGGPLLSAGQSRAFPVQSSNCSIPSDAQAYSLNVTVVPKGPLGYLTLWPTGGTQPLASTLNATTGSTEANAAIVPAGTGGNVSVFAYNDTDLILDINGYFAAPTANGLALYTTAPCRVVDTRSGSGAFSGQVGVAIETSACAPPSGAQAYVLNATVVPPSSLQYLSLWPAGESQPLVSTLNAVDGAITSNMAIVPTLNGSIDAYASTPTQLILDLSGYFAP